jgi:hypothetical protein
LVVVSAATAGEFAECGEAAAAGDAMGLSAGGQVVIGAVCAGIGGVAACNVFLDVAGHVVDTEQAAARRIHTDRRCREWAGFHGFSRILTKVVVP